MVKQDRVGHILRLGISHPPMNALNQAARTGLVEAIARAQDDASIEAIVIYGEGGNFSAGADVAEFETGGLGELPLPEVVDAVEASVKPVIAAIEGYCLGGGLELAMACHYRIAAASSRFGLPEVKLGILPGAGGTQRLPRLIGAQAALRWMMTGSTVSAEDAVAVGLVDEIVEADAASAAIAKLQKEHGVETRRTGSLSAPSDIATAVAGARAGLRATRNEAPKKIIECVEAIGPDFQAGRQKEANLFEELLAGEPSRALRHAFFGERIVGRIPGAGKAGALPAIDRIGIVGGGLMGTGIAIACLVAGYEVAIIEQRDAAVENSRNIIGKTIRRDADKGRIKDADAERMLASLSFYSDLSAFSEPKATPQLVIEAVFEDLGVKQGVFTALDGIVPKETILASNTSTLDVDAIASVLADPSRLIGLHFFSPANIMRLLEIVKGEQTSMQVLETSLAFAKRIGKIGVVSGNCDGFIGNRMAEEYLRQAYFLLEEGASAQQIDAAIETWGMAMGPLRVMDLAGQDIGHAIRKRRAVEQPDRPYSGIIDIVPELGRLGQKTGAGVYSYPDGRTPVPDPYIESLFLDYSTRHGIERRQIDNQEIVDRCLLALVNEGAKIVGEGIAYRPVDVDMVFLNGYGFARERGGPMFQADKIGLDRIISRMKEFAAERNGWAWEPAPLLVELASRGGKFDDLNR